MVLEAPAIGVVLPPQNAPARVRELASDGMVALQAKRYEEAFECFAKLGTLKNVESANYYSKLGIAVVWRQQRQFSKALEVLNQTLGLGNDRFVLLYTGSTLHQMDRYNEALDIFEKVAEHWPDDPDVWVYRIPPLIGLGEVHVALQSAELAFPLRRSSSDSGKLLFQQTAGLTIVMGYLSITERRLTDLEVATSAFIKWRDRAKRDKQTAAFNESVKTTSQVFQKEDSAAVEEFMLGVHLSSIRDPFKGWQALTKEISKHWPDNVSAVEAVREQRE